MKRLVVCILILVVSAFAISADETAGNEWLQWASHEEAGFDHEALEAARLAADEVRSASVMAVYRGNVLVAWGDVDRKLELHSVRKSLYSALWGIADAKGLADLDTTLADLGIDDLQGLTPKEKSARIVDLLRARSGVYHPAAYAAADDEAERPDRGSYSPGEHFYYNNWDFNVAGVLLEHVTGKSLGVLFDEWIGKPIGMQDYEPSDVFEVLEPGQSRWPALTIRMSTRDLARFGQLWIDRGAWNGRQVIPADWVERASAPASEYGEGRGYGMMWWTYAPGSISKDDYPVLSGCEIIMARGTGGQAIFVIPELELMVVHRGDTDHGRGVRGSAIWSIVERIAAAQRDAPVESADLTILKAVPFQSQLPGLEWPEPVELSVEQIQGLTGEYQFPPGFKGRVFLHDGRLYGFLEGQGDAELFAVSADEFFIRVDPTAKIRFDRDDTGQATKLIIILGGRELAGSRIASEE